MQSPSETVYFHVASRLATTLKRPSLQDLSILFSAEYNKIDYIQNLFINETFSNESYREQSFGSKINFESYQFHVDVGTVTQCFFHPVSFQLLLTLWKEFDYDAFAWMSNKHGLFKIFEENKIENDRWANTSLWVPGDRFPIFYDYLIFQLGFVK